MATIQIPPPPAEPKPELHSEILDAPVLLVQLADDLARSRMREAFWMSLVAHLVFILAVLFGPKYLPIHRAVVVRSPNELVRSRDFTFLQLPPDRQRPVPPPQTSRLSDKNRVATSRNPTIDRKTLQELRDSGRPGPPGPSGIASPPTPAIAQAAPAQQSPSREQGTVPAQAESQVAKLQPPAGGTFSGAMSPGSAIEQAARAAAANRSGYGGAAGDYGVAPGAAQGKIRSDLDILSDTMGVDFAPYLSRVLYVVRMNWYNLIPEIARAPIMKRGKVSIEFVILKDGKVAGMRLVAPSGDGSLDNAAWGGITASNPFPQLPPEFRGQYLALRFHFYYNPDRNELQ